MFHKKQNRTSKRITGDLGEDRAVDHLKNLGFLVLERNYWKKFGEIDIIAQKGSDLHFVEVKTVTRETVSKETVLKDDYQPEDNVHPWKIERLHRTIQIYLLEKDVPEEIDWYLDLMTVYLDKDGGVLKIDFLEDI